MTMHDELEEALDCYGCSYEELLECLDEPARARVTAIYKALAPDTPRSATTRTSRSRQYRALREALFR